MIRAKQAALRWIERHEREWLGASTVVVLGLSDGAHVAVAAQHHRDKKFIVIEVEEVPTAAQLALSELANVRVIDLAHWMDIADSASECAALLGRTYAVVRFYPGCKTQTEVYELVEDSLIGRSRRSFAKHLQRRPELHALASKFDDFAEPVSIKSLSPRWLENDQLPMQRPQMLWRALLELVK